MAHDSMWGRILAVLLPLLLLPGGEVGGEAPFAGPGAELPTLAVLLPLPLPLPLPGATRAERSVSRALPSAAGAPMSSCTDSAAPVERGGLSCAYSVERDAALPGICLVTAILNPYYH